MPMPIVSTKWNSNQLSADYISVPTVIDFPLYLTLVNGVTLFLALGVEGQEYSLHSPLLPYTIRNGIE
jgi:hypothetical protein